MLDNDSTPSALLRVAKRAFLARFDAFVAATNRKPGGVSAALFGSDRKIRAMRDADDPVDVSVETLARADEKLARLAADAGITLPEGLDSAESDHESHRPRANGSRQSAAGSRKAGL